MKGRSMQLVGIPPVEPPAAICLGCLSRVCVHLTAAPPALTPREVSVLRLLAGGLSDKEMGGLLGVVEDTVTQVMHRIFRKLKVTSRLEGALWARDHAGLLEVPGQYGRTA